MNKNTSPEPLYTTSYQSPLGWLSLTADDTGLRSVAFVDKPASRSKGSGDNAVLAATRHWLDTYFAGRDPGALPPLHLLGTPFQQCIWKLLQQIPYGATVTYGQLAERAARKLKKDHMAPRAVGSAVGRNPVAILVPCHRVIGKNGSLTGYAYGIDKKAALLELEKR